MNVNELLDTIEDTLAESANMPLSGGKRIVDVDQIQEYLDEIRANLPGELRQAQAIVNDRGQIVDSANAQAKAIIRQAEERARVLVSESEIVKSAQQRAAEIMAQAQAESRTLRQTTADYCDNMLKTTEETMIANASQVKNVRASLRQQPILSPGGYQGEGISVLRSRQKWVPPGAWRFCDTLSPCHAGRGFLLLDRLRKFGGKSRAKTIAFTGLICYNNFISGVK